MRRVADFLDIPGTDLLKGFRIILIELSRRLEA